MMSTESLYLDEHKNSGNRGGREKMNTSQPTTPPAEAASSDLVRWRDVLDHLKTCNDAMLDTPVHISCEPSDSDPEEMKRYQGIADTFTNLLEHGRPIGMVLSFLGEPNSQGLAQMPAHQAGRRPFRATSGQD